MITVRLTHIAAEKGRKFALEHPFADGATAMKWAYRWFRTPAERHAFIEAWRKEAGF